MVTELAPGIYERLVTGEVDRQLHAINTSLVERARLDAGDAHEVLARHVTELARRVLRSVGGDSKDRIERQVEFTNRMIRAIVSLAGESHDDELVASSHDMLQAIAQQRESPAAIRFPTRPEVPLSTSALLVNGREQPRIGAEIP
jgi:hypothetical protein